MSVPQDIRERYERHKEDPHYMNTFPETCSNDRARLIREIDRLYAEFSKLADKWAGDPSVAHDIRSVLSGHSEAE